jgi:hypothetical protein
METILAQMRQWLVGLAGSTGRPVLNNSSDVAKNNSFTRFLKNILRFALKGTGFFSI